MDENLVDYDAVNNKLYRMVPKVPADRRWLHTKRFLDSNEFKILVDLGHLPNLTLTDIHNDNYYIYEIDKSESFTRDSEFTSRQALDSIKLVCDINIVLKDSDLYLTDCNSNNFIFENYKPIMIDIGSVDDCRKSVICNCIVNTVEKFPKIEGVKDFITYDENGDLDYIKIKEKLHEIDIKDDYNKWSRYPNRNSKEIEILSKYFDQFNIKTLVDLGGNNGSFSWNFYKNVDKIIIIDNCENSLDQAYTKSIENKSNILCAKVDLIKDLYRDEKCKYDMSSGWLDRLKGDCLLASSIVHHLLNGGMSLEDLVYTICRLCDRYAMVEWIDKSDRYANYDIEFQSFIDSMGSMGWNVIGLEFDYDQDQSVSKTRKWCIFQKV